MDCIHYFHKKSKYKYLLNSYSITNMSKNTKNENESITSGFFDSNSLKIYYETFGKGKPIILIHAWSTNLKREWLDTQWVEALSAIRWVVALDCRGHGKSGKPHNQKAYS